MDRLHRNDILRFLEEVNSRLKATSKNGMDDCLLLMDKLGIFEENELLRLVEKYTKEENRDPAYRFFVTEAYIRCYQKQVESGYSDQ